MPDTDPVQRMTVRFPLDLYTALTAWAKEDGRSLHGQIIYLLRKLVADRRA